MMHFYRRPIIRRIIRPIFQPIAPVYNESGPGSIYVNGGGVGPPGPPGPAGNPSPVAVTIVNTSPYIALPTDYDLAVTANAVVPASIVLPVSPVGTVFIVKDAAGVANINSITVSAIASTIDGSASATIDSPYGSLTFVFNGIEWNIV